MYRKTPQQLEMDALLEYERETHKGEVVTLADINPRFFPGLNDHLLEDQPELPLSTHSWPRPRAKIPDALDAPRAVEAPQEEMVAVG